MGVGVMGRQGAGGVRGGRTRCACVGRCVYLCTYVCM
jgi:hypothetical protein